MNTSMLATRRPGTFGCFFGVVGLGTLLFVSAAQAADALAPVNEIMAALTTNWKEAPAGSDAVPDYVDYFSPDFLARLYSRDFVAVYREAAKYPAYDGGDSPFSYDVIAMGQDGCAIEDLKVEKGPTVDGVTTVDTQFDNTKCFGERAPDWKPSIVVFKVIEEDGKAVIDDIVRPQEDVTPSLKDEMKELVKINKAGETQQ